MKCSLSYVSLLVLLPLISCTNNDVKDPSSTESAAELAVSLVAEDWKKVALPEQITKTTNWQLQPNVSDSFNYSAKNEAFFKKWHDNHIRGWLGPGATHFSSSHSYIDDNKLVLTSSPVPADKQGTMVNYDGFKSKKTIYTGFVTAKELIQYPVYVEASLKISKLALANNFWMLSDDDRNEIDVTETYGDSVNQANHMSSNYHIFKRDAVSNNMVADYGHKQGFHKTPDHAVFYDDYHRFGFYWQSPTYMEFYLDGVHVRTLSDKDDLFDPEGHFMDRGLRIIFDMEDHVWRAKKGITPSIAELEDETKNKMFVDWIRTYVPVE